VTVKSELFRTFANSIISLTILNVFNTLTATAHKDDIFVHPTGM